MSNWKQDGVITFEERTAKNGKMILEVYDARHSYRQRNGGMARQFQIPSPLFKPSGTVPKRGYYIRREAKRDFSEVIVWDWSEGENRFFVGDITPEKAERQIAEWEKKQSKRGQPLTDEQQAEMQEQHARAVERQKIRQRNFHIDTLVLAGCEEEEVEAAIEEIGMPKGCQERKATWVNQICQRLDIDIVTQSKIRRVLCGRET